MTPEQEQAKIGRVNVENPAWKKQFDAFYSGCPVPKISRATPHAYFAAYHAGRIVGHSVVYRKRSQWFLDSLRVSPEWRERGIGKALTAARIRFAVENGAKEILYDCEDGNLVTTCCHLRFGFRKATPEARTRKPAAVHRYRLIVGKDTIMKLKI